MKLLSYLKEGQLMINQIIPIFYVFVIALIGGFLFEMCSIPIPWMLGPLFSVLAAQFFIRAPLKWPLPIRNIGLVILGITIGQNFSLSILHTITNMFGYMIFFNIVFIALCLLLAYITFKWTNMSLSTAITASVPGALGQIIVFAEEQKNIDVATVTYFHIIRVLAVVGVVPFIVSGHVVKGEVIADSSPLWAVGLLLVASYGFARAVGKINFPVPYFLGPVVFGILLNLVEINTPHLPLELLNIAQIAVGAYIGLLLKPSSIKLPKSVLVFGLMNSVLLMFVSFLCAKLLMFMLDYSYATSFLSTAPGGMDQMALIATSIHADPDIVTVFQLFRMLFLSFIILPLLKKFAPNS